MEISEDLDQQPWWRFALKIVGGLLAMAVMGGLVIGLIVFVVDFLGGEKKPAAPTFLDLRTPVPPDNPRTRAPQPYAPVTLPNSPARSAWNPDEGGDGGGAAGDAAAAAAARPAPSGPVGMSVEEYREAIRSGQRIVLPNPQGECDLGGQDVARSIDALENCFARQAAR